MRVRDAIREYLGQKASESLKPGTMYIVRHVLETVFEPAMAEDLMALTAERLMALRSWLFTQASQTTGAPLAAGTRHTYLQVSRAFLVWCAGNGWMSADLAAVLDPDRPPVLPPELPTQHLGELVRMLREAAGLTRQELADRTGLDKKTLLDLETGRHRPSRWALQLLLKDPSMSALLGLAQAADISLALADEQGGDHGRGKPS